MGWFVLGLFIGGIIGFFAFSLCNIQPKDDKEVHP
jgi:hypothetical protein